MLYYSILYCTILYYTILYYTILYCTILYYTILYYTTLHYTLLYYTCISTVLSESHCALRLRYVDLVVSIEVAVEVCYCCVTFHCIQLLNSG